jgi:hypothetical protein
MKFLFEYFMDEKVDGKNIYIPYLMHFINEFERMYVFYEGLKDYLDEEMGEDSDLVWVADQDLRMWDEAPPALANTIDIED